MSQGHRDYKASAHILGARRKPRDPIPAVKVVKKKVAKKTATVKVGKKFEDPITFRAGTVDRKK
jgi:hypothetical protein